MQALELMKTHVVKTTPDAPLGEAVDLMDLYQVHGLPVVDDEERLCGMLTESDVLRAMSVQDAEQALTARAAALCSVRDYMTHAPLSVRQDCNALVAARLLLIRHLKQLPVLDDRERVVGILNRVDVFQAIFEGLL